MSNKIILIAAFVLLCAAQIYFPAQIVWDNHVTLTQGNQWKFKCAPVDPNDPFRGKYITLRFEEEAYKTRDTLSYERSELVYAILEEDSLGYARIKTLSKTVPDETEEYLKATVRYEVNFMSQSTSRDRTINLDFPFNRFYMEEGKANMAERVYTEARTEDLLEVYAVVKIKNGNSTLDEVYVNSQPIREYVDQREN